MLSCLNSSTPEQLLQKWTDGRIKMFLTQRALQFRNKYVELFRDGNYMPLPATGMFSDSCITFAREQEGRWVLVLAPRLSSRVGFPPIGERWQDTIVTLPEELRLDRAQEIFTGREMSLKDRQLKVADAMSVLPFAVLTNVE